MSGKVENVVDINYVIDRLDMILESDDWEAELKDFGRELVYNMGINARINYFEEYLEDEEGELGEANLH